MRVKNQKSSDTITIYWCPGRFILEQESWNMLYQEPTPVIQDIFDQTYDHAEIRKCPGTRSALKNVFAIKATHEEKINFPPNYLQHIDATQEKTFPLEVPGKLQILKQRTSEYPDHVNLVYNMSWYFFASEPVEAKMTAPYYPPTTPTPGSSLFPGEFNIGQWYRPFNLEYSIPLSAKTFSIAPDDPLFFLEIKTDKKIVFQRYSNSPQLDSIAAEFTSAPKMFGARQPLLKLYALAQKTQLPKIVLNEIQKNLIS